MTIPREYPLGKLPPLSQPEYRPGAVTDEEWQAWNKYRLAGGPLELYAWIDAGKPSPPQVNPWFDFDRQYDEALRYRLSTGSINEQELLQLARQAKAAEESGYYEPKQLTYLLEHQQRRIMEEETLTRQRVAARISTEADTTENTLLRYFDQARAKGRVPAGQTFYQWLNTPEGKKAQGYILETTGAGLVTGGGREEKTYERLSAQWDYIQKHVDEIEGGYATLYEKGEQVVAAEQAMREAAAPKPVSGMPGYFTLGEAGMPPQPLPPKPYEPPAFETMTGTPAELDYFAYWYPVIVRQFAAKPLEERKEGVGEETWAELLKKKKEEWWSRGWREREERPAAFQPPIRTVAF